MNTENVVIEGCTAVRATNKALCVKFADGVERWIPKSQMAASSQVQGAGSRGNLVVSQWWADNAKLGAAPNPNAGATGTADTPLATAATTRRPQGKPLENKPGSGCMFHQRAEGKRPDWRGAVNIDGKEFTIECSGLLARACQHELDHLNGVLFVDHLSPVKKQLFKREYAKERK